MSQRLITVFGATGAQGSSVLRSLSQNTTTPFKLRGITRNTDSSTAKKLASEMPGVEFVQADGWDEESLINAFKGSWGAFVNTNSDDPIYDAPGETRTELDLGKKIVDAAVKAGVEIFVYSGFNSAKEITNGKLAAQAFDEKHAIGEYATATKAFKSISRVSPGWYFENFLVPELAPVLGGFPFNPNADGELLIKLPRWGGDEDIPFIAINDDYGDLVHGVFLHPEKWNGKLVQGVSDIKSWDSVADVFTKVTGKKARFEEVSNWEDFQTYSMRSLETIKLMFGFCQLSGGLYYGEKTESGTALGLKKEVAAAKGLSAENTGLANLEDFFSNAVFKN